MLRKAVGGPRNRLSELGRLADRRCPDNQGIRRMASQIPVDSRGDVHAILGGRDGQ